MSKTRMTKAEIETRIMMDLEAFTKDLDGEGRWMGWAGIVEELAGIVSDDSVGVSDKDRKEIARVLVRRVIARGGLDVLESYIEENATDRELDIEGHEMARALRSVPVARRAEAIAAVEALAGVA